MKDYSTDKKERKVFTITMTAILLMIIAWGVMEIRGINEKAEEWPQVTSYPMANAKISWEQTYHGGAW